MNTENQISSEDNKTAVERLATFITQEIEPKSLAKKLRRLNYVIATDVLSNSESGQNTEWANTGFYWINELAEILDPMLDIED
jgi:hypothetical protein